MEKLKEILSLVVMIGFLIFCIVQVIFGINYNDSVLIVIGSIGFILCAAFVIGYFWLEIGDLIKDKKERKNINKLINKSNKSPFDYFMIDVVNEEADKKIAKYLTVKNDNIPYELWFSYKDNIIHLNYGYRAFYVEFKITKNSISLYIDSPEKYDYVDGNKELETKKEIDVTFDEMSLEDIYIFISDNIKECNNLIKDFVKTNKPDAHINGKTISKIEIHTNENKALAIILFLFSLVVGFVGVMSLYLCIINDESWMGGAPVLSWIFSIILCILTSISLIASIRMIYRMVLFRKDKKQLQSCNIVGKCIKVKFYIDGTHKSSEIHLKTMTLYLKTNNNKMEKAVIIVGKRFKFNKYKPNIIKKSMIGNEYNFCCLKYSKYVLTGASKIISHI